MTKFDAALAVVLKEECGKIQDRLAAEAGVGLSTVKGYEGGKSKPIGATLAAMRAALEKAGIVFVDDDKTCGVVHPKAVKG